MNAAGRNFQKNRNEWLLELIFWVVSVVIALMVLMPVWTLHLKYEILWENILGLILAFQVPRIIFMYRHTPYMTSVVAKVAVLLFSLLLFVLTLRYFSGVVSYMKDEGFFSILTGMDPDHVWGMAGYMRNQLVFSYTAALLGLVLLPLVLIRAIWKQYNRR